MNKIIILRGTKQLPLNLKGMIRTFKVSSKNIAKFRKMCVFSRCKAISVKLWRIFSVYAGKVVCE